MNNDSSSAQLFAGEVGMIGRSFGPLCASFGCGWFFVFPFVCFPFVESEL